MSIVTHESLAADNATAVDPRDIMTLESFEGHIYSVELDHPESPELCTAQELLLLSRSGLANAADLSTVARAGRSPSWADVGSDSGVDAGHALTRSWMTGQEWDVIIASATGRTSDEVAERLGQTTETIRCALAPTIKKLGAHSKLEAVVIALRLGLIDRPPL